MNDKELIGTVVFITGSQVQQVARQTLNRELSGAEIRQLRLKLEAGLCTRSMVSHREKIVQDAICELLGVRKLPRWDVSWCEYHEATVTAETSAEALEAAAEYAQGHNTLMDSDGYDVHAHVYVTDPQDGGHAECLACKRGVMESNTKNKYCVPAQRAFETVIMGAGPRISGDAFVEIFDVAVQNAKWYAEREDVLYRHLTRDETKPLRDWFMHWHKIDNAELFRYWVCQNLARTLEAE